jgi:hypothetical protein
MSKCSCNTPTGNPCERCQPIAPRYMNHPCNCVPIVHECKKCTSTQPITQMENPCYETPVYCSDGCVETIASECVTISNGSNQSNVELKIKDLELKIQELSILFNMSVPNSVISYKYDSECVLPTLTSVKKNGVEELGSPVTNSRNVILLALQAIDSGWQMTTTSFQIYGTDIWEININC